MMKLSEIGWMLFQRGANKIFNEVECELKGESALYLDASRVLEIDDLCFELRVARLLYEKDTTVGNSFSWSSALGLLFRKLPIEMSGHEFLVSRQNETIKLRLEQMLQGVFNGTYTTIEVAQQLRHYAICNFNPRLEVDARNVIVANRVNLEELYFALLPWSVSNSFSALPAIDLNENDATLMVDVELLLEIVSTDASDNGESLAIAAMRGAERVKSLLEAREAEQ